MLFVATIHNNSLGACVEVQGCEVGLGIIQALAEARLERPLTAEEIEDLNSTYEFSDLSDSDNQFTWSIGQIK